VQSNTSTVTIDTGEIGEQLVQEHFKHAERSEDWYDSEKDGTIKDDTYEVKTFRLNNRDQGFWVESSQFTKLDNVDILYFVKIPESLSEGATIYECIDHKNPDVYENFTLGQFKQMRCYFIDNCKEIANVNDERTDTLYNNSVSMSKHKRFT
jgi:hypothetical protein|tara:strand:+ start:9049 stop:9504 length:456 start_codon:yes stop_codon:yes gene_type:complete